MIIVAGPKWPIVGPGGGRLKSVLATLVAIAHLLAFLQSSEAAGSSTSDQLQQQPTISKSELTGDSNGGQQQQQKQARILLDTPASVNLKAILEHQEGLAKECAMYHDEKLRQLEQLFWFAEDGDNNNNDIEPHLHLPRPLPVKVPAVCLFLFSQFGQARPQGGETNNDNSNHRGFGRRASPRLEFVNWIYGETEAEVEEELFGSSGSGQQHGDNVIKRETGESPDGNQLLSDYLLDPSAPKEWPLNERETNQTVKLHRDIGTMMADERFRKMIDNNRQRIAGHLSPVILVPGLLGSRLEARTDKKWRANIFCSKQSDWQDLWLSLKHLLPLVVDCWLDNVRLEFDPRTGFTKSPAGVQSRVANFGSVESVRHLDRSQPQVTPYFAPLIDRYEQLGYTADENLLAAPYDFRLAPQELGDFFAGLKELVERAQDGSMQSGTSGSKKVTLVCHSMGCTHLLVFLRLQSAAWRQSRIRKLIALSSPWGGAIKALKALVVGDQLSLPLVSEAKIRRLARTYPSIAYLMPQAEVFARPDKRRAEPGGPLLVETPQKLYRAADIEQLLADLNLTRQLEWFKATSELIKPLEPLADLHVDCIHSLNVPTPETLIFRNQTDFPDGDYELIKGEGDGTVNAESLLVCRDWAQRFPDKVKHTVIMNTDHTGVLRHKTTLTHITDDVLLAN